MDMLIAQLSDVHVGGARFRLELLRAAIEEVNAAAPDLVVVAGDLTDDGYPDQYPEAREELAATRMSRDRARAGQPRRPQRRLHPLRGGVRRARLAAARGARRRRCRARRRRHLQARHRRGGGRARALRVDRRGFRRLRRPARVRLPPPPDAGPGHRPRAQPGARRGRRDRAPATATRRPSPLGSPSRPLRLAGRRDVHRPFGHRLDPARARFPAPGPTT